MILKTIQYFRKQEKLRVAACCRVSMNHPEQFESLKTQKSYFETMMRRNLNSTTDRVNVFRQIYQQLLARNQENML